MTDDLSFTLRQVDQSRSDFAAINAELEALHAQLARIPTRMEIARTALAVIFGGAGLVIGWFELFWRHGL
jgi:hypothetical protein